ncbi:hypothetical protein BC941DRAFT_414490 [Chlamydoabsidia padenii]|nr:hypothetical protein BC941DRAFT_414490 [Chlamydoabsidia padenii]
MPPKKQNDKATSLSKAQEEEMSSALIAKLLAQDDINGGDNYYAEYSNDSRHYDNYHGHVADNDDNYEYESDDYAPKRQAKPKKTKISRHLGTRDSHSIRSHAQKHFIKLFRDNLPLPDKVKESGEGYTLSGKPLDPESAAAKSYLNRGALGTNKMNNATTNGTPNTDIANPFVPLITNTTNNELCQANTLENCTRNTEDMDTTESVRMAERTMTALTIGNSDAESTKDQQQSILPSPPSSSPSSSSSTIKKRAGSSSLKSKKKLTKKQNIGDVSLEASYEGNGRTNYASSRLRRPRSRNSVNFRQLGHDDDPLTMVKCEPFIGKPGSNTVGSQPFKMTVHSNVLLMMDFHAHLMTTEIIGFLAGEWDKTTRRILVKEAYPCRSLNTGQNDVNVEMDPTSALEIRHLIEEKNMTVVGWYHSHPTFIPDPSLVDIENQCNYQNLCRDECHTTDTNISTTDNPNSTTTTTTQQNMSESVILEPFVGAIVGPYDPKLPASASVINWFHVNNDWNQGRIPKRLVYDLEEDTQLSQEEETRLFQLPVEYKLSPEKVNFGEYWRHDAQETKLEKLIKSLAARMPWIQQKVTELREQRDAALSISGDDIPQNDQTINDDDFTMDDQSNSTNGGVIDTFLEKVQETLKAW